MANSKWISVRDRMPKDGEQVLCQLDDEFYDENTMMVLYHTDDWGEKWVDGGFGTGSYDVCAWMPLPKPYTPPKQNLAFADKSGLEYADQPTLQSAT